MRANKAVSKKSVDSCCLLISICLYIKHHGFADSLSRVAATHSTCPNVGVYSAITVPVSASRYEDTIKQDDVLKKVKNKKANCMFSKWEGWTSHHTLHVYWTKSTSAKQLDVR